MEKCPVCHRIYQDHALAFCVDDGARLVPIAADENVPRSARVQPDGKNRWLMFGGIAAAGALLVVIAGLLVVIAVKWSSAANANANQSNAAPNPAEKYKPEVLAAISRANDAIDLAFSTYNTDQLRTRFSGEALKNLTEQIELLQKNNLYRVGTLDSQEIRSLNINDAGAEADTKLVQIRSSTFKDKLTGKCVGTVSSRAIPQVWHLKKTANGWIVDSIIYDPVPNPSPVPCS